MTIWSFEMRNYIWSIAILRDWWDKILKRRGIILLILAGLFLPVLVNAAAPQPAEIHPHATVDFWVDTNNSYRYYWSDLPTGYTININVEVTSGSDIDFYILDEENYDLWDDGQSSDAERGQSNVGSVSISFTVPSSGEWNLLFINDNWLYRKHIEGTITVTATTTYSSPTDSDTMAPAGAVIIAAVILFIIGMAALCCKKFNESQQEPPTMGGPPHKDGPPLLPLHQPVRVQQEQVTMFCPYCGTQRQSHDAQFCSKCGRAFT